MPVCSICGTNIANANICFTDKNNREYKTVSIGNQIWMAENLNYDCNGSEYYNKDSDYGKQYGRLYTWEAAKSACPSGWHLPSDKEWQELINFCGGERFAGTKLKAIGAWASYDGVPSGTDEFDFCALPGGLGGLRSLRSFYDFRYLFNLGNNERFDDVKYNGYWWTASKYNDKEAYYMFMSRQNESFFVNKECYDYKSRLLSVRYVMDQKFIAPPATSTH